MAERKSNKRATRKAPPASSVVTSKAVAAGKEMAREVVTLRKQALRKRDAAVRAATRARGAAAFAAKAAPAPARITAAGAPPVGVLVAEGDSWFDYPLNDVLRMLEDRHGYDVESVAHKGDRVEDMAYEKGQLEELTRLLEKLLRRRVVPDAILLSGGGNDVAGDEFAILLNHAKSATRGLNESIVSGVIDDRIRNAYVTIVAAVTEVCKQKLGSPVPIVLHGYDHAVPDGRGFFGGWGPLPGPWLEPGFRVKGFTDLAQNKRIVEDLIGRFNGMLADVAGLPGFEHVHHLDLRRTLKNDRNYKTWWANELHPTARGFELIADRFKSLLDAI